MAIFFWLWHDGMLDVVVVLRPAVAWKRSSAEGESERVAWVPATWDRRSDEVPESRLRDEEVPGEDDSEYCVAAA